MISAYRMKTLPGSLASLNSLSLVRRPENRTEFRCSQYKGRQRQFTRDFRALRTTVASEVSALAEHEWIAELNEKGPIAPQKLIDGLALPWPHDNSKARILAHHHPDQPAGSAFLKNLLETLGIIITQQKLGQVSYKVFHQTFQRDVRIRQQEIIHAVHSNGNVSLRALQTVQRIRLETLGPSIEAYEAVCYQEERKKSSTPLSEDGPAFWRTLQNKFSNRDEMRNWLIRALFAQGTILMPYRMQNVMPDESHVTKREMSAIVVLPFFDPETGKLVRSPMFETHFRFAERFADLVLNKLTSFPKPQKTLFKP